ncbi:hypothetical protein RhiJN_16402 [Ceratobasidium sp. AG-Ba]|nr:hypothetical protein RhiJN_16402 [Ceratobasidium sp. AG-Ba]
MPPSPPLSVYIPPELDLSIFPSLDYRISDGFIRRHPEFLLHPRSRLSDSWVLRNLLRVGRYFGLARSFIDRKSIGHNLVGAQLVGSEHSPIESGIGADRSSSTAELGHSVTPGDLSAPGGVQQASIASLPPPYQSQASLDHVSVNSAAPGDDSDRSRLTESSSRTASDSVPSIGMSEAVLASDGGHMNFMDHHTGEVLPANSAPTSPDGQEALSRPPTPGSEEGDIQAHRSFNGRGTAPGTFVGHAIRSSDSVLPSRYKPWTPSQNRFWSSGSSATFDLDTACAVSSAIASRRESGHWDLLGTSLLGQPRAPRVKVGDVPDSLQAPPEVDARIQTSSVSTGQRARYPSFLPFV